MSETKQFVRWRLAFNCLLRRHDEWANEALVQARSYSECRESEHNLFGVWDGVCVTSVAQVETWTGGNKVPIPYAGFIVNEAFAATGGPEGLTKTCGDCPANAALDGLAGCSGWLPVMPYDAELDEKLRQLLHELHLESAAEAAFLPAGLLWFRFWMESPLPRRAMEVLHPLLDAYVEREWQEPHWKQHRQQLEMFLRAVERSLYFDVPLHAELIPPGHREFGWHWLSAHCPRCKAVTSQDSELETLPESISCAMCYHEYEPTKTQTTAAEPAFESYSLRVQLGDAKYRSFAVNYLIHKGRRRHVAESAVDRHLASGSR